MKAFIFPGQGSQSVGMGVALAAASPVAREVFQEVDEALGQHLFRIMCDGPESDLTLTENAQPAIMANAIATLRVLEKEGGLSLADKGDYVAGHSLGEYTALCAAQAMDVPTTARLLKLRGQAMQAAVPVGVGAMAALLGLDFAAADAVAKEAAEGEVCQAANDNDPAQVVVSGHKAAVERAVEIAKARGAKRAMLLPVSAPFHCALMQPAAHAMAEALSAVVISKPVVPVVVNVRAEAVEEPDRIFDLLVAQVTGSVRWRESVLWMERAGVTEFWEIGAGKALSGMIKRIVSTEARLRAVGTPEDVAAAVAG